MRPISQANGRLAVQLDDARVCLADLARRGAHVLSVQLGGKPCPLILLARPPRGLQGGTIRISGGHGPRIETLATRHLDCQLEWRVDA